MIVAFSFCEAKRESRYSPVSGLVNAHATGVCDADSIPFKQKNDHPGGVAILLVDLKGIDLRCGAGRVAALRRPRRLIHSRSRSIPPENIPNKRATPSGRLSYLVDLKGIEPSNLTDANRALSQLSYKPIFFSPSSREPYVLYHRNFICKEKY